MKVLIVLFVAFGFLSLTIAQQVKQIIHCCQNDLCPVDCERCDGKATCYDLSDELGCSNNTDSTLLSYKKPPVFVPFILNILKSRLRQEKMDLYRRNPFHACFRAEPVTTTPVPVWLQLLRKLQAERGLKDKQPTTRAPLVTVTELPVWKQLLQRLKDQTTTTSSSETTLVDISTSPGKTTSPDTTTIPSTTMSLVKTTPSDKTVLNDTSTLTDITPLYDSTTQPGATTLFNVTAFSDTTTNSDATTISDISTSSDNTTTNTYETTTQFGKTTQSDRTTLSGIATSTQSTPEISTSVYPDNSSTSSSISRSTATSNTSRLASTETNVEVKSTDSSIYSSTTGLPVTTQSIKSSTRKINASTAGQSLNTELAASTPSMPISTTESVNPQSSSTTGSPVETSTSVYARTTSMPTKNSTNHGVSGIPVTMMSNERYYSMQQKLVTLPSINTTASPEVTSTMIATVESSTPVPSSSSSIVNTTEIGPRKQSTETLTRSTHTEVIPMSTDKTNNAATTSRVSDTTIQLDFTTRVNEETTGLTTDTVTQTPTAYETTTNPAVQLLELLENMLNDSNTDNTNMPTQNISSFLHGNHTFRENVTMVAEKNNDLKRNISEYVVNNGSKDSTSFSQPETITVSLNGNFNNTDTNMSEYSMLENPSGGINNIDTIIYNASTRDNTVTVSSIISNEANTQKGTNELKNQISTGHSVMSPDNEIRVILGRLHSLIDNEKHNYSSALTLKEFDIIAGVTSAKNAIVPPTKTASYTTVKVNSKPKPFITPQPAIWPQTTIPPFTMDNLFGFTSIGPVTKKDNTYQSSPNPFAWNHNSMGNAGGSVPVPSLDQKPSSNTQQSQDQLNVIYDHQFKQEFLIPRTTTSLPPNKLVTNTNIVINDRINLNERGTTPQSLVDYPLISETYSGTTSNPLTSGSNNQDNANWIPNVQKQENPPRVVPTTPKPFDINNRISNSGPGSMLPADSISSWWQQVYTTVTPPIYTAPTTTYSSFSDAQQCFEIQDVSGFCQTRSGHFNNPTDCRTFYVCMWGYLHRCSCPPNTMFDSKIKVCNWDSLVTCGK